MLFLMSTFPTFATQYLLGALASGSDVVSFAAFCSLAQRVPSSMSTFNDSPSTTRRPCNVEHIDMGRCFWHILMSMLVLLILAF